MSRFYFISYMWWVRYRTTIQQVSSELQLLYRTTIRHFADAPLFITTFTTAFPFLRPFTTPFLLTRMYFLPLVILYFFTRSFGIFLRITILAFLPFLILRTFFLSITYLPFVPPLFRLPLSEPVPPCPLFPTPDVLLPADEVPDGALVDDGLFVVPGFAVFCG